MPEKPSGYILCYRTGASNQGTRECILKFPEIKTLNEAAQLVGKTVAWPINEHKIKGKIVAIHGKKGLVKTLGTSALRLETLPDAITCAGTSAFLLKGPNLTTQSLQVSCPPLWKTTLKQAGENQVECTIQAPASTSAREARIYVRLLAAGNVIGELMVPLRVARADSGSQEE